MPPSALVLLGTVGIALTVGAVWLALSDAAGDGRAAVAVFHGSSVAIPVAVGVWSLARRPRDRFALLLVGAGFLWAAATLAEAHGELLYSIGRIAAWSGELAVVYLLLAFPSGRLRDRIERRVFGVAVAVYGLLFLPTALIVQQYPQPSPWTTCDARCPPNAFALTSTQPAMVDDVVRPLREVLVGLVWIAVAAILARRTAKAGPLMRRALAPVLATAAFRVVAITAYTIARRGGAVSEALDVLGWVYSISLPLVALGFAGGQVARRLHVARTLQQLALRLRTHAEPAQLRAAMADALEDPSLQVLYWIPGRPGRWVDETGWPVRAPEPDANRDVTEIRSDGRLVSAIDHDASLGQDPALMSAASSYALVVLENGRLVDELRRSLYDLTDSRARIVAAADEARREIERDLHDGAQQRLVSLRVRLAQQSLRLEERVPDAASALARLGDDVETTIDEVRELGHGIYPSLLADRGLPAALRHAARGAPIPTTVLTHRVGRYRPEVEATVYFACVEALQNAVKHARAATHIDILLTDGRELGFEVRDDGGGFDPGADGNGLTNLHDRLRAMGGVLRVDSRMGGGTRVSGSVPTTGGS